MSEKIIPGVPQDRLGVVIKREFDDGAKTVLVESRDNKVLYTLRVTKGTKGH